MRRLAPACGSSILLWLYRVRYLWSMADGDSLQGSRGYGRSESVRSVVSRSWRLADHWASLLCLSGLAAVLLAVYWPAASMQGVFYVGDIYRLNYPARQVYAQGLAQGHVPLWTPDALGGYPILAEGQTGAYYPLNLLLHRLFPLPWALNYSILLAFWIAGAGTFAYARSLGLRRGAAWTAGCAFMLGGFLPGHLDHVNMLIAAAWLPLLLWAVQRACKQPRPGTWTLVAVLFALQGLAGHPQVSLLSAVLACAHAAFGPFPGQGRYRWLGQTAQVALCVGTLCAGAALASVQWAPTFELTRLSQRGQGLDSDFFTSFSLHPLQWITMLWPFVRGNPFPSISLETIGYMGALPLVFALLAPWRCQDRVVLFWSLAGVAGLILALGHWNPAYRVLLHVPLLNMFRAPARYLLWVDLAVAVLAAVTVDSFLAPLEPGSKPAAVALGALVLLGLAGLSLSRVSVEGLVAAWRYLPLLWLLGCAALIGALRLRPSRHLWFGFVLALLLGDLGAFNAVYNRTYNAIMPPADFMRPPDALRFLQADAGQEPYRIYTLERIVPVLSVMRESLYPNIQLLHGVQSLNGYYPLVPEPQQWLLGNLNPRLLDLLNVRYVLIPQLLPVDEATEFYDTEDPFAPSIAGRTFEVPAQEVSALEVEGYLSHSAELTDGTAVAEIVLEGTNGQQFTWTLRAGFDLAEWAYLRDDVQKIIRQRQPSTTVRTWPAQSGFPPRQHVGQTYLAHEVLKEPLVVQRIVVRPLIPQAYVRLERLRLIDPSGHGRLLSSLVGEGDHVLVYRSADVAIYRNENAGPRAFLVHQARVAPTEQVAEQLLMAPEFDPRREVILQQGDALAGEAEPGDRVTIESYEPERVRVRVQTAAAAYLVLADSYYPGWIARLDGQPVAIRQADVCLRAVAVPAGEHVIEFTFAPISWRLGSAVSGIGWAAGLAILALDWRRMAGRKMMMGV